MTLRTFTVAAVSLLLFVATACAATQPSAPATHPTGSALHQISVNGVVLHYTEHGSGAPVVFVHGGLADYREWLPTAGHLPEGYRSFTYSRRYDYPNRNPLRPHANHSALIEAEDLAALLRKLKIAPAHLIGVSYGAYTVLLVALKHPELVRTIVLAEPPLMKWLPDLPGGQAVFDDFMTQLLIPVGKAFRVGDQERALRLTIAYFTGSRDTYDQLPPEDRSQLHDNSREWEALTTSRDSFPAITRDDVRRLKTPALIIKGEKTYQIGQLIDPELMRLLPSASHAVIPNGTHEMCSEYPNACADAIAAFLARNATHGQLHDDAFPAAIGPAPHN
jgi:pimeloyl-ACP methyl ester carboxylesterase